VDPIDGGVDGLAERALAVIDADADGVQPAYVCGESFGGTVALTLARQYPERVRGLILLSTFGCYPSTAARGGSIGLAVLRLLGDHAVNGLSRFARPFGVPGALGLPCSRDALRTFLGQPALHLPGFRAKREMALTFDARPWLGEIACPTFILTGSWDPIVPITCGRELARRIPHARLHTVPGRHLVHLTRAAEAGELISRWVAETSWPSTSPAESGGSAPEGQAIRGIARLGASQRWR
jgi:pimeloyl-ACP methyl ester carboxylesterase